MSDKGQIQNLVRCDGNNAVATNPSPKYTPQFSAATQMILERINSRNSGPFPAIDIAPMNAPLPGYEDMRRSVLQSMRTSMNMKIPVTPIRDKKTNTRSSSSIGGSAVGKNSMGASVSSGKSKITRNSRSKNRTKRKRMRDESEDSQEESDDNMSKLGGDTDLDDSDVVTRAPKVTLSGRHVVKPVQFVPATYENSSKKRATSRKALAQALCKLCGRGHSPLTNMIVFCDGCNLPWHQKCHEPLIPDETVQIESILWFCADCSRKKGIKSNYEVSPKGISWAGRSMEEEAYLNSQSHSQLVTLILQATYLHPDIPLFPWPSLVKKNRSQNQITQSSLLSTATTGCFPRVEPYATSSNFIRRTQSPAFQTTISSLHSSSIPSVISTQENQRSRESTPASPSYPKPGNGLMAKIGPDDEDIDWLVDSDDYVAFSHTMIEDTEIHNHNLNSISTSRMGLGNGNIVHGGIDVNGMGVEV